MIYFFAIHGCSHSTYNLHFWFCYYNLIYTQEALKSVLRDGQHLELMTSISIVCYGRKKRSLMSREELHFCSLV
jgi:hypothetical protein